MNAVIPLNHQFVLNSDDKKTIDKYTSEKFLSITKRQIEYMRKNPKVQLEFNLSVKAGAKVGGVIGGGIGGVAGGFAAGPVGVAVGIPTGVGIGALFGGIVNGTKKFIVIKHSNEFNYWKLEAIKNNVYPIFMSYLERDHKIEQFLCPISHSIILDPVHDNCEGNHHVFERAAIIEWLDKGNQTCPMSREALTKNDLKIYWDYHRNVIGRLKKISEATEYSEIKNGIEIYIKSVKALRAQYINQASERIQIERRNRTLTEQEAADRIANVVAQALIDLNKIYLNHFMKWKLNAEMNGIYQSFLEFLNGEEQLRQFRCPITHSLILNPLRDPHGYIFEKKAINKRIVNEQPHPVQANLLLEQHNLIYDWDYHRNVIRRINEIPEMNENIRRGMDAYIETVKEERAQEVNQLKVKARTRLENGVITLEQYAQEVGNIVRNSTLEI